MRLFGLCCKEGVRFVEEIEEEEEEEDWFFVAIGEEERWESFGVSLFNERGGGGDSIPSFGGIKILS